MLEELFEVFERKKDNRSNHHDYGRDHDRNRHPGFDQSPEEQDHDHKAHYSDRRDRSHESDFGHRRLTDLLHNKKIMTIALIAAPIAVLLLVGIGILMFPTISRAWEFVSANGVKGIMEAASPLIRQLWQGSNS
jgi:hypothetical protein